jgi:hypothetical protein
MYGRPFGGTVPVMPRLFPRSHRTRQVPNAANPRPAARELAARVTDGLQVLLLWHPAGDTVTVAVADDRTGHRYESPVARDRALDAFYHPFAYVA